MARGDKPPQPMGKREPLANTEQVAAYLGNTPKHTLETWRSEGRGPKWTKVGRQVLYDWADVDEWLKAQKSGGAGVRNGRPLAATDTGSFPAAGAA